MALQKPYSADDVSSLSGAIDAAGVAPGAFAIPLQSCPSGTNSLKLTIGLDAIGLASGDASTIMGDNDAIDGGGDQREVFVFAGNLTIETLTLEDMKA